MGKNILMTAMAIVIVLLVGMVCEAANQYSQLNHGSPETWPARVPCGPQHAAQLDRQRAVLEERGFVPSDNPEWPLIAHGNRGIWIARQTCHTDGSARVTIMFVAMPDEQHT